MAGSWQAEAQAEKPRQCEDSPGILLENRRQALLILRGPSAAPWRSIRSFPTHALGRRSEQASGADQGLHVFGSCVVSRWFNASRCGTARRLAARWVVHQHQKWEGELNSIATRAQPSGLPHLSLHFTRITALQTPTAPITVSLSFPGTPGQGARAPSVCVGLGAICRRRSQV